MYIEARKLEHGGPQAHKTCKRGTRDNIHPYFVVCLALLWGFWFQSSARRVHGLACACLAELSAQEPRLGCGLVSRLQGPVVERGPPTPVLLCHPEIARLQFESAVGMADFAWTDLEQKQLNIRLRNLSKPLHAELT